MSETFYDLLGVSADASTTDIEAAYRESIKEVHPDVSDDVDASERTKRLNKAKRVLTDEAERARYDRVGHETYTGDGPTADSDDDGTTDQSPSGSSGTSGSAGGPGPDGDRRRRRRRRSRRSTETGTRTGTGSATGPDWATGREDRTGSGTGDAAGSSGSAGAGVSGRGATGTGDPWSGGPDASRRRSRDATGPSRASSGPSWQSQGRAAAAGSVDSPSARRQAAAGSPDGPNVDWSWNAWERSRSWAVRGSGSTGGGFDTSRLSPVEQSLVLLASAFFLYPIFIFTIVFPPFPIVARAAVAVCTILLFAYLLSFPEVAIVVYGVWSLLVPLVVFLIPGLSIFSLAGVVGLSATWVPLGLSVLTLSVLRP